MKKTFYLFALSLLSMCRVATAQPDIGVDSINIAKSLRVYEFTASASQLFCPYDPEMIHPGYNITVTWTLDIWNLGNMNKHLGCGDGSTPGIEYDSCRGYNKYTGFCEFAIYDRNCNVLAETEKALYAIVTSQHYLSTGSPWHAERLAWLQRMCNCIIDVAYFNSLPDTSNGTTLCPVLGPGYMDRYGPAQPGNWLNIELPIGSGALVVGETYYFEAELYPEAIAGEMEGTVFKNSSGKIPFRWDGLGADGKYHLTVLPEGTAMLECAECEEAIPPAPSKIQIRQGNVLTWSAVSGADEYKVYARMAYIVQGKVEGWHDWDYVTHTSGTTHQFQTLPGTWQYSVAASNCAGTSDKTISRKD